MSLIAKKHVAAILQDIKNNPPINTVTRAANYSVNPGTTPTFVSFTGTTSRFTVQHNTAGVGIGNIPYNITFSYRRVGNPQGNVSIGIRKAAGDTFTLIAQHPIEKVGLPWVLADQYPSPPVLNTVTVEGSQEYQMIANDKVSIEFPPDATNTIELACGTGLPSGFTSQQYTGSYGATTNPLAVRIVSKVLTAI